MAPERVAPAPGAAPDRRAARARSAAIAPAPASAAGRLDCSPGPVRCRKPPGQTITTVSGERIRNEPAFTVQDLLQESPGVSFKQGNGPRDLGISIRGSNARNGFGIRNIVVLEDGFPVTQPDGLSRTDLTDPHAYGGVDVYRGPSSAMFGNYATGGAINFRLWRGGEINGARFGTEGGSFGYLNNYAIIGGKSDTFEGAAFGSDVRGDGYISHSSFNTQTINALGTYAVTPNDRVTFKVINNWLFANLAVRLSLNQFQANPFQRGCDVAATAAPGCATVNLFANGFSAADRRADRRAGRLPPPRHQEHRGLPLGARFRQPDHVAHAGRLRRQEHQPADRRDQRDRRQPLLQPDHQHHAARRPVRARGRPLRRVLVHLAGAEQLHLECRARRQRHLGRLSSFYDGGHHVNWGGRAREEIKLGPSWTAYVAGGVEYTTIAAVNTIFSFPGGTAVPAYTPIQRDFLNTAPEAGLLYRPTTPGSSAAASPPATARRTSAISRSRRRA